MRAIANRDRNNPAASGPMQGSRNPAKARLRLTLMIAAIACVAGTGFFAARQFFSPGTRPESRRPAARSTGETKPEVEEAADDLRAEGLGVARQVMRDFPGKADSVLLMGQAHYRLGNSAEATKFWQEGLKLNPNRADAHDGMAWIAMRKGDYETAAAHWRKALEISPGMPEVRNGLARALMGLGKVEEAAPALEEDVRISPRSSLSHFLLGQCYLQLKNFDKAKEAYQKAIEIDPNCTNAYYGLATSLTKLRQPDKAKEAMKKFQELKAEDMKVLKNRNTAYDDTLLMRIALAQTHDEAGRVYRKEGNIQQAEKHWERAAALDPKKSSYRLQLAALYEATRRIPDAIRMHEEVMRLEPENAGCCFALASLYDRAGRLADAEKVLRKGIELSPRSSWGYRDLARLYLRSRKNVAEAKSLAQRAVELEPTAANFDILGWALYASGEVSESLSAMERAMELDPANSDYRRRYEQIRQRQ